MTTRRRERSQAGALARREARRRVAVQAEATRQALQVREAAAQAALGVVLDAERHLDALGDEQRKIEEHRRAAILSLVEVVGRVEAAALLGLPERSLRARASGAGHSTKEWEPTESP